MRPKPRRSPTPPFLLSYGIHLKDVLRAVRVRSGVRRHLDRFRKFVMLILTHTFYIYFKGGGSKP